MRYSVPEGVHTIYECGKRYSVIDGVVEIPGKPVGWLTPIEEREELAKVPIRELRKQCEDQGIALPEGAKKAEILTLLQKE